MKIWIVLWTRPEIIKFYSIIKLLEKKWIDYFIIDTLQHYDYDMRWVFYDELGLWHPKHTLKREYYNNWTRLWGFIAEISNIIEQEKPNTILIQWDTDSALAWALAWYKSWIKVWHVEAWLRSYNREMHEEINRINIDSFADYLFCPTHSNCNLITQEWCRWKIVKSWNTIVDILEEFREWPWQTDVNDYILLTLHRQEILKDKNMLKNLLININRVNENTSWEIIFPIHPWTKSVIKKYWLFHLLDWIKVVDPLWYKKMIWLISWAKLIMTDSWWIQEEASILWKKCLILRNDTERVEVLVSWWIELYRWDMEMQVENLLKNNIERTHQLWNWQACSFIVNTIIYDN